LGRPGDGIFLYPPGPIASTESAPGIRLKAIRDGIQDYEYAQILKNLSPVPIVNSILQPVATSWSNWSHDPNALEAARTTTRATAQRTFQSGKSTLQAIRAYPLSSLLLTLLLSPYFFALSVCA